MRRISAEIRELKKQYPKALLTVAYLEVIYSGEEEQVEIECSSEEYEEQWAEEDNEDDGYWVFITGEKGREIQIKLSEISLLYDCGDGQ